MTFRGLACSFWFWVPGSSSYSHFSDYYIQLGLQIYKYKSGVTGVTLKTSFSPPMSSHWFIYVFCVSIEVIEGIFIFGVVQSMEGILLCCCFMIDVEKETVTNFRVCF